MNKKFFIVIGVILVTLVISVWLYLFLSGDTSKTDGVFAGFGTSGDSVGTELIEPQPTNSDGLANAGGELQRLRQLTLRPAAGAVLIDSGIMFVEQGTGHVFHLNLNTGNETLVSGTTILGAYRAVFSTNGTYVAITNYTSGEKDTVVGSISSNGNLEGVSLPGGASEIWFGDEENLLYYLLKDAGGSRGYVYDIEKASASELFNIPLKDVRVNWGDDVYVYTTPTATQEGYVYQVVGNELEYVTGGSMGLLAFSTVGGPIVTKTGASGIASKLVTKNDGVIFGAVIPEKCVNLVSTFVCATPTDINPNTFPEAWYKGTFSYSDLLWEINTEEGTSLLLSNLLKESGREIDVIKIGSSATEELFYLINKNDNSLWLFDNSK